ncbi:HNH endonuclease signature motif containing protein [Mesorhizobium sp. M1233]|uniref:HNH endonuclease signature motif containing protein n=1 Tax=Mesorhizobium sp. M1233 TaxID=2957072 RepID=UPI00333D7160
MGTLHHDGYGQIRIGGQVHRAHRLSYELHRGPIPDGLGVLHRCDCRPCANPDHLYAGTEAQNVDDAVRRNRIRVGEASHAAKLTNEAVLAIRASDAPHTVLAKQYGCSRVAIRNARIGRTWKHIP